MGAMSDQQRLIGQCHQFLKVLMKKETAMVFLNPVSIEEAPDYPRIVKRPMDLTTIDRSLRNNEFRTAEEFWLQLQLVWHNAMKYNAKGSQIYEMALGLYKECQDKVWDRLIPKRSQLNNTPLDASGHAEMKAALKYIMKNKEAMAHFNRPLDYKKHKLFNYPDLIKTPMDLGTVLKNLERGQYRTLEEGLEHIDLVWSNCIAYNGEGEWISKIAVKLKQQTDKKFQQVCVSIGGRPMGKAMSTNLGSSQQSAPAPVRSVDTAQGGADSDREPTLEEKHTVVLRMLRLKDKDMFTFITFLEKECPQLLVGERGNELEVDFEQLDRSSLKRSQRFLRDHMQKMQRTK